MSQVTYIVVCNLIKQKKQKNKKTKYNKIKWNKTNKTITYVVVIKLHSLSDYIIMNSK